MESKVKKINVLWISTEFILTAILKLIRKFILILKQIWMHEKLLSGMQWFLNEMKVYHQNVNYLNYDIVCCLTRILSNFIQYFCTYTVCGN